MKKSILAAGALSLAVSFAFGTMASAGTPEPAPQDQVVAKDKSIGGLGQLWVGGAVLVVLALSGRTTSTTTTTTSMSH